MVENTFYIVPTLPHWRTKSTKTWCFCIALGQFNTLEQHLQKQQVDRYFDLLQFATLIFFDFCSLQIFHLLFFQKNFLFEIFSPAYFLEHTSNILEAHMTCFRIHITEIHDFDSSMFESWGPIMNQSYELMVVWYS